MTNSTDPLTQEERSILRETARNQSLQEEQITRAVVQNVIRVSGALKLDIQQVERGSRHDTRP
jgi:hypothetical protein